VSRGRSARLPRGLSGNVCPESGKATGLVGLPKRRVRCAWCGRLVHLVPYAEHIIVATHQTPAR
jgi:hypothetical protein